MYNNLHSLYYKGIEQKGMTFDHDFGYSFHLSSSLLKKREEEKENKLAKILIKSHAFLLDHYKGYHKVGEWVDGGFGQRCGSRPGAAFQGSGLF